jgi:hypothetical protein
LLAELQAFRASIGESGDAKFEAAGVHDDLVLAVALARFMLMACHSAARSSNHHGPDQEAPAGRDLHPSLEGIAGHR